MQKSLRNIETAKCEARFSETPLYIFNSFAIFVCWWGLADRKLKDFLGITTVLLQMPPVFWKSRVKEDERYSWQSKIIFPKSLPILISWVYINFQSKSFKVQNNYYYIEKEKKHWYMCVSITAVFELGRFREGSLCEQHVDGEAMSQSLCFIIQWLPHLTAKSEYILEVDWGLFTSLASPWFSAITAPLTSMMCATVWNVVVFLEVESSLFCRFTLWLWQVSLSFGSAKSSSSYPRI